MGWTVRDRVSVGTRFSARPDRPWAHPVSCKMGTGSSPGVKCGRGLLLTTHLLLVESAYLNQYCNYATDWSSEESQFNSRRWKVLIPSWMRLDCLRVPPYFPLDWFWSPFPWIKRPGRKAYTHFHIVSRIRMNGAIPPLLNTPSCLHRDKFIF